jgi:hypothetical protein
MPPMDDRRGGTAQRRYVQLGAFDRVFNSLVAGLARLGVSLYGSRILAVRGKKSGLWRTVPVNLLELDGARHLVAPRGETDWVRNLRAAGAGELRLGFRREPFRATEVTGGAKLPPLRAYIGRWWFEVSRFFDLTGADASDADLARVAPDHPVFRLDP